ncbi:iron uptake transporter deferrochelatase/peroxidase subunit [Virgibacillus siamensis]|uniref:iron uptake transporter deferrochelatase/peroxidase subunit n=1 Tax=Virgibacillus siamensis TaxID=480071 RepID=UPI0031835C97
MNNEKNQQNRDFFEKKYSRRSLLKTAGIGGVGVFVGASGLGGILSLTDTPEKQAETLAADTVPFYGKHQAGIATKMQNNTYVMALNITADTKKELTDLFRKWTKASDAMASGKLVGDPTTNEFLPPDDTGETIGLSAANLTITFGVGPTLFTKDGKDRFGIAHKKPKELKELPVFSRDRLEDKWSGGDVCIQACSDDSQVAFHAVRNLVRIARGKANVRWAQEGFQRTKKASEKGRTPRNLFGFKDGTVNPDTGNNEEMNKEIWVQPGDGPDWLAGGSYLVFRRIQMFIEVWDRTTLKGQEETFGRHRDTGAPLGKQKEFAPLEPERKDELGANVIPVNSHASRAHGNGKEQILRRSYSYSDGMDPKTGTFDAGLLFMCYQRKPSEGFIPIQKRLAQQDKLNEYIVHKGSAVFACLPGTKNGGFIGETLFY